MKRAILAISGAAVAALATFALLGSSTPAEASSSSGGKDCAAIKVGCNDGCKSAGNMMQCYATCMINARCPF